MAASVEGVSTARGCSLVVGGTSAVIASLSGAATTTVAVVVLGESAGTVTMGASTSAAVVGVVVGVADMLINVCALLAKFATSRC